MDRDQLQNAAREPASFTPSNLLQPRLSGLTASAFEAFENQQVWQRRIDDLGEEEERQTTNIATANTAGAILSNFSTYSNDLRVVRHRGRVAQDLDGKCTLCQTEYATEYFNQKVVQTPCKHIFHNGCLSNWHKSNRTNRNTCPLCRTKLFRMAAPEPTQPNQYDEARAATARMREIREYAEELHQMIQNELGNEQAPGMAAPAPTWLDQDDEVEGMRTDVRGMEEIAAELQRLMEEHDWDVEDFHPRLRVCRTFSRRNQFVEDESVDPPSSSSSEASDHRARVTDEEIRNLLGSSPEKSVKIDESDDDEPIQVPRHHVRYPIRQWSVAPSANDERMHRVEHRRTTRSGEIIRERRRTRHRALSRRRTVDSSLDDSDDSTSSPEFADFLDEDRFDAAGVRPRADIYQRASRESVPLSPEYVPSSPLRSSTTPPIAHNHSPSPAPQCSPTEMAARVQLARNNIIRDYRYVGEFMDVERVDDTPNSQCYRVVQMQVNRTWQNTVYADAYFMVGDRHAIFFRFR